MTLRKPYSEKQQEYIDSVDGNAHMSAVGIIGELEARDKEHLAEIEKQTKTILNQADKIADFVKYFEGNECRKGLTAKPCHCEAPKKELATLKQFIEDAPRYSAIKTTDVPVLFIGDKVPYKLDGGYGDGILEITKVALLEVEK